MPHQREAPTVYRDPCNKFFFPYINKDLKVRHHDVDFFCWGTPYDYETYQRSFTYWSKFISNENK